MTVRIEIEPVDYYCNVCDGALVETGCLAPVCNGQTCPQCEVGCDLDDEDGFCAMYERTMTYPQRLRAQEERQLAHLYGIPVRTVELP